MNYDELLVPKEKKEKDARIPLFVPTKEPKKKVKDQDKEEKRVIIIDI